MTIQFKIIALLLLLLVLYSAYHYKRTRHLIDIGNDLADRAVKYEQHTENSSMKILVIGDSTAVGTGASTPEESTTGRLGQDYPKAEIVNLGVNGSKTHELPARLEKLRGQRFDLILIHTGGNDIVRLTPYKKIEENLRVVLQHAKELSDTVVVLHGGNVGTAKIFPAGIRWIFTHRTRLVRDIFLRLTKETSTHYVDLWRRGKDDPFFADPDSYYAADYFHPSSVGYKDWYEHIAAVLKNIGLSK